jgi:hypothetical protein
MVLHFYNLELHHAVGISESDGPKEEMIWHREVL